MNVRHRLPDRRYCETFDYESAGLTFAASFSRFDDGTISEIFIRSHKADSTAGINASDAAVLFSIARQYGAPFEVLRKAMMRDGRGRAQGHLGVALDEIAKEAK